MRSKGVNVSRIATGLGGGGHIRAAGCTLKMTLDEAEKILVDAIGKSMLAAGELSAEEFATPSHAADFAQ